MKLARIPGPSWQGFQVSSLELRIVSLSRYQSIVRRPKELEPVANLPGLDVVTSDGRCSLVGMCQMHIWVTYFDATSRT